jgi:hypothetical protein
VTVGSNTGCTVDALFLCRTAATAARNRVAPQHVGSTEPEIDSDALLDFDVCEVASHR